MTNDSVRLLTNEQLLADVATAAGRERETTARLIVLLSEIDSRRLYLGEGYSSLFTFCTQRLHLSEHAAYGRIEAARAARRFPVILELHHPRGARRQIDGPLYSRGLYRPRESSQDPGAI
jgi:hypothetical protein